MKKYWDILAENREVSERIIHQSRYLGWNFMAENSEQKVLVKEALSRILLELLDLNPEVPGPSRVVSNWLIMASDYERDLLWEVFDDHMRDHWQQQIIDLPEEKFLATVSSLEEKRSKKKTKKRKRVKS